MTETNARHGWGRETAWVAVLAGFASVISFLTYFRRGDILLFGDAVAHINIARRVFDSRTPGLLQLGTVWLPLPHLLMIPFLLSNWMWQTGVGGSVPSMAAYVLGVTGIFRLVRAAAARPPGECAVWRGEDGVVCGGGFGLNPNLLYVQTTAMTESLYTGVVRLERCVLWRVCTGMWRGGASLESSEDIALEVWSVPRGRVPDALRRVVCCGCDGRVGDPVRMASAGGDGRRTAVEFVLLSAAVPVLGFTYNAIVYPNPLEFANGPHSARAIETKTAVPGFPPHPGTNNLPVAAAWLREKGGRVQRRGRVLANGVARF